MNLFGVHRKLFTMETVYTAGLIIIGDEILRGQVIDTNTSYLAKRLRASGIKLRKITVIPDIVCIILLAF